MHKSDSREDPDPEVAQRDGERLAIPDDPEIDPFDPTAGEDWPEEICIGACHTEPNGSCSEQCCSACTGGTFEGGHGFTCWHSRKTNDLPRHVGGL